MLQYLPAPGKKWRQISMGPYYAAQACFDKLPKSIREHDAIVVFVDRLNNIDPRSADSHKSPAASGKHARCSVQAPQHAHRHCILQGRQICQSLLDRPYQAIGMRTKLQLSTAFHSRRNGQARESQPNP